MIHKISRISFLLYLLIGSIVVADVFKNQTTAESFTGFRTNKKAAGKVLVYNADLDKLQPMDLTDYEVKYSVDGRRNSAMIISITQGEVLLSKVISQKVSETIRKAADKGPKLIILKIDSPGGAGMYMKNVATAVTSSMDNTGCPIVAYLPGGTYGGAFSSAAVVALACEKIYMSPTAAMGAAGPVTAAFTNDQHDQYLTMYSPESLATYSIYATALAQQNNRPAVLARALVDKQLSIAEVRDINGKLDLVELSTRQPTQTIVRMITEGTSSQANKSSSDSYSNAPYNQRAASSDTNLGRKYGKLLNLTPTEAIQWGMADKTISSVTEIIQDMKIDEAQIVNAPGTNEMVKKFIAHRRNLNQALSRIQVYEDRVATLQDHIAQIEKISRTGTTIRETNRRDPYQPRDPVYYRYDRFPERFIGFGDDPQTDYRDDEFAYDRSGRRYRTDNRHYTTTGETIITQEPSGNLSFIQSELLTILQQLTAEYQQAIAIARRWPGAIPKGLTLNQLQQNMDSAEALSIQLQQYLMLNGF